MRRTSRDFQSDPYSAPLQPTFRTSIVGPRRLISAVGGLAVSLSEAKSHCYIQTEDDDVQLARILATAQSWCERMVPGRRQIMPATYDLPVMDFWEGPLVLTPSPLQSVSSVKYDDTNGTETTLATTVYKVDAKALDQPGTVERATDQSWPSVQGDNSYPVRIRFIAGYLAPITAVAATDVITSTGRPFNDNDRVRFWKAAGVSAALPAGLEESTDYWVRDASGSTFKVSNVPGGSAVDITGTGTGQAYCGLIPEEFRQAVLMLAGHWYAHREAAMRQFIPQEMQLGLCSCLEAISPGSYA